ncbi:MAG: aryl-sulfate sulfotransferase [Alphaproteobacteria bacterium]|nr:aryl-sulfate sulfotransferase [Alphaproteobacteria bacterium]
MVKRSLKIAGHLTSVSLEHEFWDALKVIAKKKNRSVPDLVAEIDRIRAGGLSSAIRVYVLQSVQETDAAEGNSIEPTEVS